MKLSEDRFDLGAEVSSYKAERSWRSPGAILKRILETLQSVLNKPAGAAGALLLAGAFVIGSFYSKPHRPSRQNAHVATSPARPSSVPVHLDHLDTVADLRAYYTRVKNIDTTGINISKVEVDPQLLVRYRTNLNRPSIMAAYDRNPPSLFLIEGLDNIQRICGWRFAGGCQLPGTNAILLLSIETHLAQMHEVTHYLFGLVNDRFVSTAIDVSCNGQTAPFNTRIEEGGTEFVTQQVINGRMDNPRYPLETQAIASVADIAGPQVVIDAYFTRNWCPVARAFDARFATLRMPNAVEPIGSNSFSRLVGLMAVADSGNTRAGEYHDPSSTYIQRYVNDLNSLIPRPAHFVRPAQPQVQVRPRITRIEPNLQPPIRPQRIERIEPGMRSIRP